MTTPTLPSARRPCILIVDDKASMRKMLKEALEAQGLTDLLLACTELPMAFAATRYRAHCLDSTLALAKACVAFSRSDHQN